MVIPGTTPTDEKLFNPPGELQKEAHIPDFNSYLRLYKKSIEEPEEFWKEVAEDFFWKSPPKGEFLKYNFDVTKGNVNVKFMEGAKTNICYNILDRNVNEKNRGEKVAYYWEGNSPSHSCSITYNQLLKQVCKFANVLKNMEAPVLDRQRNSLDSNLRLAVYRANPALTWSAFTGCATREPLPPNF
ncbi:UNVERIFIED_CONTAM: hypothetical protein FKN15_040573 [Acipenser sinensis]